MILEKPNDLKYLEISINWKSKKMDLILDKWKWLGKTTKSKKKRDKRDKRI